MHETILQDMKFQYISVIETLTLLLSNEEIFKYVTSGSRETENGLLSGFEDGDSFKYHPFFSKFKDAIVINLYFDEFLVNNPLGSKTKNQKIGSLL